MLSGLSQFSSSSASEEVMIEGSEKDPVISFVALEDSKEPVPEAGDQMGFCQDGVVVPETLSEELGLPQSSLIAEEKKIEGFSEKEPCDSSMTAEDSKGFESELCDQIHVSQVNSEIVALEEKVEEEETVENVCEIVKKQLALPEYSLVTAESKFAALEADSLDMGGGVVPETVSEEKKIEGEKVEGSSEKKSVGCSILLVESKGPEAEAYEAMEVDDGRVAPEMLSDFCKVSSFSVPEEAKIEGKHPVSSFVVLEDSKESVTESGMVVPETFSEDLGLPSSSLVAEEKKIECFSVKDQCDSAITVEDSKGVKAELYDQIHFSQVSSEIVVLEEKIEGFSEKEPVGRSVSLGQLKIEGFSEKDPNNSSVTGKDSKEFEAESCDEIHVAQVSNEIVSVEEKVEEAKMEGFSEKGPVGSSISLEELRGTEVEACKSMDVECRGVVLETIIPPSDLPSSCLAIVDEKVESSSDKEPVGLSGSDKSKGPDAEAYKSMDVEGGGVVPETVTQELDVPTSSLGVVEEKVEGSLAVEEESDLPLSSLVVVEEKVEGPSDKEPVGLSESDDSRVPDAEAYKSMDVEGSQVLPETVKQESDVPSSSLGVVGEKVEDFLAVEEESDLPSSSLAIVDEKVKGSSDKEPVRLAGSDESRWPDAEAYKSMDVEGGGGVPETVTRELDVPASSSGVVEEKVDGSSDEDSVSLEESDNLKGPGTEAYNSRDAKDSGLVPETVTQELDLPSSSLAAVEEKVKGSSDKESVGLSESDKSEGHESVTHKPTDVEGRGVVPDTVAQELDLPSSSLAIDEEKVEGCSDKEPVCLSDHSEGHESEAHKPTDDEGGGIIPETVMQ